MTLLQPGLARAPALFNIPLHVGFADALAAGLLARCDGDPLRLAGALVLLPNRRAVTALTEAFVRQLPGGSGGLLLPRLVPVGDLDDGGFARLVEGAEPLPPAVPALVRRFELARLSDRLPGGARTAVERLRLGDALGAVLDALLAAEIPPEALRAAADGQDLADHWQKTLAYLELIIAIWPEARGQMGQDDGLTRLAALIDAMIARWQAAPPAGLVVAAGIANPTPALVRLLAAVLRLPDGMVVLPGLDDDSSAAGDARWQALALADPDDPASRDAAGHPQWGHKRLLAGLGLQRADVRPWPNGAGRLDGPPERAAAMLAALAPAVAASTMVPGPAARAGLALAECATAAEEAQVVALALREALESPGRRAALITPDPVLARRVAAHCRRWGIAIDSSAGTPLALMPPGALALGLADALAEDFAPARLLAVLKNRLVRVGDAEFAAGVALADLALRGVRPPAGLDAAGERISDWVEDQRRDRAVAMAAWWQAVASALEPLEALREARQFGLSALAAALRRAITALAGDAGWAGPDGRQLAALIAALEADGERFGSLEAGDAPAVLAVLIGGVAVRVPGQGHPRLAILGPVEAQLARADLLILAGLNEATWPGRPSPDPWLAPAIRARLGLPGTALAQGLAAQDFLRAVCAPTVLITRARRDAGGPQVPSRLWLRLIAQYERAGQPALPRRDDLVALARALDGATGSPQPAAAPLPNPALHLRPRRVTITEMDTLVADPFAFHARRILNLKPLDPLDQDPTPAMRGTLVHAVLERWIGQGHGTLAQLDQIAVAALEGEARHFPRLAAAWVPRMRRALLWAGERILAEEAAGWRMRAEVKGELPLGGGVVLHGKIDRVDRHDDGRLRVVDYKTGPPPSGVRVRALDANQLALGLAMAAAGGLRHQGQPLPGGTAAAIEYWQLKGARKEAGTVSNPLGKDGDAPAHVAAVLAHAADLAGHYLLAEQPFRPKLRPAWAWDDFDHLARVGEWINRPQARP
ncbi:MAG: double-strand break repair protein AddB [Alphaproteobacteria bacterium]|nr:double-strand break repair protein AddB [Alphaproteobacteria bacterium]